MSGEFTFLAISLSLECNSKYEKIGKVLGSQEVLEVRTTRLKLP